jgi:hypothetical protein
MTKQDRKNKKRQAEKQKKNIINEKLTKIINNAHINNELKNVVIDGDRLPLHTFMSYEEYIDERLPISIDKQKEIIFNTFGMKKFNILK